MDKCSTQIEQRRVRYEWTIQQFSLHLQSCKNNENLNFNLKSSTFTSELRGQEIEWTLQLRIKESDEKLKNWISFTYHFSSEKNVIIRSREIYIINYKREKQLITGSKDLWKFSKPGSYLTYQKFYERDAILEDADTVLPNDTLTIIFEAVVSSDPFVVIGPKPIELPECKVLEDYVHLFPSREDSDVTFMVSGESIKAHKVILMTRSAVFATMFNHDMIENKENCVNVTDMKPAVFMELLRFIYTNQVCKINEFAEDLLQAADKYQMETLKQICEHELFQSLNIENAAQILIHADNHNCPQLKTHTIDFINKNKLDVINTQGFKIMTTTHPQLVVALYHASH